MITSKFKDIKTFLYIHLNIKINMNYFATSFFYFKNTILHFSLCTLNMKNGGLFKENGLIL